MKVETFECEETRAEHPEVAAEAVALIESLGLKGQASLVKAATDGKAGTRSPYREATAEEVGVYKALCPQVYALRDYARSSIPLRVLQVCAHADSLDLFDKIEVWDRESVQVKDPVAVGVKGNEWDSQNYHVYLLARWGEELEEFPALRRKAIEVKRERLVQEARGAAASATAECAKVAAMTDTEIIGVTRGPTYHGIL